MTVGRLEVKVVALTLTWVCAPLRARLRELAAERRRFGYRRLGYLLAREGMTASDLRAAYQISVARAAMGDSG